MCRKERETWLWKKLHQANLILLACSAWAHLANPIWCIFHIKKGRKSIKKTWISMNDIITFKKTIFETESKALIIISVLRIVSWTVKGLELASSYNLNQKYENIQEIWIYKKEGNKHLKNRGYATIDLCVSLPRLFYAMQFHK